MICVLMLGPILIVGPNPAWFDVGEVFGYTSMVLAMSATFLAMRRERRQLGALSFGRAFRIGMGVSLLAAAMFGIATWIFYAMMGDMLPQALYDYYVTQASGNPVRLAELESMRGFFFNRPLQAALMFATVFLIGLVESLIGAWIVSRARRSSLAGERSA